MLDAYVVEKAEEHERERGQFLANNNISTGETWNLMKIGYQLKQVRERLAKGLVDKGILRTEKRNFLLFDMATHPVTDNSAKDEIRRRVRAVLTNRTVVLPPTPWLPEEMDYRYLRTIAMLCAAYAANVLENALSSLGHEARERAFAQVDEMLAEYSQWPFGKRSGGQAAMGANLDAVIREEIGGSQERELQMEVCSHENVADFCKSCQVLTFFFSYRLLRRAWASSLVWILCYKGLEFLA
jgi:Golgi phosphoprotein 3